MNKLIQLALSLSLLVFLFGCSEEEQQNTIEEVQSAIQNETQNGGTQDQGGQNGNNNSNNNSGSTNGYFLQYANSSNLTLLQIQDKVINEEFAAQDNNQERYDRYVYSGDESNLVDSIASLNKEFTNILKLYPSAPSSPYSIAEHKITIEDIVYGGTLKGMSANNVKFGCNVIGQKCDYKGRVYYIEFSGHVYHISFAMPLLMNPLQKGTISSEQVGTNGFGEPITLDKFFPMEVKNYLKIY